jgi:serine phosphatase RsbU (regulator of sigma subunit)
MANRASAIRNLPGPPLGVALALSILCWLLVAASAPAAIATRSLPRSPTVLPPSQPGNLPNTDAPGAARPAPGAAGRAHDRAPASGTASPAPASPAVRPRLASPGKAERPHPSPAPSAEGGQRPARERPGARVNRSPGSPRLPRRDVPAAGEGAAEGEAGAESGLAGVSDPAAAVRGEKGRHRKPREPKKGRKPVPRPVDPPHAVAVPATIATSVAAAPAAVAPVAPVAPVATPAAATAPRTVAQAPSGSTVAARTVRPRPAAGAKGFAAGAAPAATRLLAVSTQPATAVIPRAARKPAPRTSSPTHGGSSPLVTTVTKIINVVPLAVRIVIAALVALALALAVSSRFVALRARRLARQRRELLDDVGLLQAALLPALPGRVGPVGTSAAYRPASGPGAGGDFYDVFGLGNGQLAVIVGDVSGHGRAALPHTTLLRFTLRAYLEAGLSPRSALQAAAPVLERQLGNSLATVVLATYDPRDRILVYACAGHPPPLVIGTDPVTPILACSAPPIGAGQPAGTRQTVVSVPGGALACFYTDGVIEARVGEELFGASRLERLLGELGPEANASALLDSVVGECDRRPDDMAACLLRIEGEPAAPAVQIEELELDRRELARGRAERFLRAGGIPADQVGEVLQSVRGAMAKHGGVVLELHLGDGSPRVVLRPQNVAVLYPPAHATADVLG